MLALIFILALSMISLSGCGADQLIEYTNNTLIAEMEARFVENQKILDALKENNLISDAVYKSCTDNINKQKEKILSEEIAIDKNEKSIASGTSIINSVSWYRPLRGAVAGGSEPYIASIPTGNEIDIKDAEGNVIGTEPEYIMVDGSNLYEYSISNFLFSTLCWNGAGGDGAFECNPTNGLEGDVNNVWYKNNDCTPITILDSDQLSFSDLNYTVYTLKPSISSGDGDGGIDGVVDMLRQYENENKSLDTFQLNEYFQPATYADDPSKKVKLIDLLNVGELVVESQDYDGTDIPADIHGDKSNRPGYDMTVNQKLGEYDRTILKIKFEEFNKDAVDRLFAVVGIDNNTYTNTKKWLFVRADGENRVYLMEYPVHYIESLQDASSDPSKSVLNIAESDLGVNILSGSMIKYTRDENGSIAKANLINNFDDEAYLTMAGSVSNDNTSQSAFVISGSSKVKLDNDFGAEELNIDVSCGRIILRDYLEATYVEGLNSSGEDLVVFGRKLRFINLISDASDGYQTIKVSKDKPCAMFVDKEGNQIAEQSTLRVSEFCDIPSLLDEENPKILRANTVGESNSSGAPLNYNRFPDPEDEEEETETESETGDEIDGDMEGGMEGDMEGGAGGEIEANSETEASEVESEPEGTEEETEEYNLEDYIATNTINSLPWESTNGKIQFTTAFPGPVIGTKDYNRDSGMERGETTHQLFYAVATTADMFTSDLYTSWINSDNSEASLVWWRKWLNANLYLYEIDSTNLEHYLYNNYKQEMGQVGIVIIDLETAAKIQDEMREEEEVYSNRFIRTVFKILSWFLIVYGIILYLAWYVDTSIDIGLDLVTHMTFGAMIPVKNSFDMPQINNSGKSYVDYTGICTTCITIIGMGLILLLVDVFDIILFFIKALGVLATQISKIITGV